MKIYRIAKSKEDEYLYHGGYDFGDNPELKSGHQGGKPSGNDSGAIFLTPSEQYAKQYMKHPKGLYKTKMPVGETIFDIANNNHCKQFIDGSKNWEDYDNINDAKRDAINILNDMKSTMKNGAIDWGTASHYIPELQSSGFTGAKFLERPAENIEVLQDGSFKTSGDPVYSYALFRDSLPVERV